jgi:hypothetical protein
MLVVVLVQKMLSRINGARDMNDVIAYPELMPLLLR